MVWFIWVEVVFFRCSLILASSMLLFPADNAVSYAAWYALNFMRLAVDSLFFSVWSITLTNWPDSIVLCVLLASVWVWLSIMKDDSSASTASIKGEL